jgi:hypothetical protein
MSLTEKKCLIILGMHRSGTSALAGAIALAGLNPGKQAFNPGDDNPKGYFENAQITTINEKILNELYARWNETQLIPDEWWLLEKFDKYLQEIPEIILGEFEESDSILIKDPRLSVLLPIYLIAFRKLEVRPVFVICLRNPFEIADSLINRNHLTRESSLLLWMDYQLKAEQYTRNYPRVILSYPSLLNDPIKILGVIQAKLKPGIKIDLESEKEILSFLETGLKHYNLDDHLPEYAQLPQLNELYDLLNKSDLRDLSDKELKTVDLISAHFFGMMKFYYGLPKVFEAALVITFENNEKQILKTPVKYGNNELTFTVDSDKPVSGMKFRPANSWVGLRILKIKVNDDDQDLIKIDELANNSSLPAEDNLLIFETEMPEIIIEFPSPKIINKITFTLVYVAFGRITDRIVIYRSYDIIESLRSKMQFAVTQYKIQKDKIEDQERTIQDLNRSRNQLEAEIETIRKSMAWRIGRFITAPARFLYKP